MRREEILAALAETPSRMADAAALLAVTATSVPPPGLGWNVADVIRHMRASDAIISHRLWSMLLRNDAVLWAYDEREWGRLLGVADQPLTDQVNAFRLRRLELVAMLRSVTDDQWARSSEHETNGTMTLLGVAAALAGHEVEHWEQLNAFAAR